MRLLEIEAPLLPDSDDDNTPLLSSAAQEPGHEDDSVPDSLADADLHVERPAECDPEPEPEPEPSLQQSLQACGGTIGSPMSLRTSSSVRGGGAFGSVSYGTIRGGSSTVRRAWAERLSFCSFASSLVSRLNTFEPVHDRSVKGHSTKATTMMSMRRIWFWEVS